MANTFTATVEAGKEACVEHSFDFIGIYETRDESNVADGWDRFIISPVHVSANEYQYIGFVRKTGEFVGRKPNPTPAG